MRSFVFAKAAQALGLMVLAFVLLRVVGPWLVDLHSTPALILAAALLLGGALLIAWWSWALYASIRKRTHDRT